MNTNELLSVSGKKVIVTGGGGRSQYGCGITKGLLEAGANVIITSRDPVSQEEYRSRLREAGYDLAVYPLDLEDPEGIDRFTEKVFSDFGSIDALVNNAVLRTMSSADDFAGLRRSLNVNLGGTYQLTKRFIDRMIPAGGGSIVNIGSMMGMVGPNYSNYEGLNMKSTVAYYAEKAALINMSRWIASTYGNQGIRCNTVSPGGMFADQDPVFVERYNKCTFIGRMANQDDIKGLIVYLVSEASAYMTGENIVLDGGYIQK
jgi:NAD(P)-dependent dehydrogenase (short-subunit alcohol dehydrogenase family)